MSPATRRLAALRDLAALRGLISVSLCALLLVACATNPVTGRSQLTLFTEAEEIQLGVEGDREMLLTFGEYLEDPELSAWISDLGHRMAAASERPDLPWTFRILDDEVVNAFALPGGQVYVTRGLLAHLGRESEVAGVLGHEIGHVTARHAIHGMSRDLALSAAVMVGLALADAEDAEDLAAVGLSLLFLKFSRNQERQSDALATRYVPAAGLDPYGAVDALRTLSRVSAAHGDGWLPTWLSTHPDPERRWQLLAETTGLQAPADGPALRAERDRYLQRLDGLVLGADPRNGTLRGALYLHPRDGFQIAFPAGWTIEREGQTVYAANPAEDAYLMLLRGAEETLDAAEEALTAETGVNVLAVRDESLGGFPARLVDFDATLDAGDEEDEGLRGVAALVPVGGHVVKLIAFGSRAAWDERRADTLGAVHSFRRLADPAGRAARPDRLRIVTLDRPTTLRTLSERLHPGADVATVALLNGLEPDAPLAPGQRVKLVQPGSR